jgi:16S rRNA (cytosine967-C5)-methyltransferase
MTDDDKAQDRRLANHVVTGGRLRALVLELWQRTRIDWGFVTDRLSTTFRKETWIGAHDRRFIAETLYGLVRHVRRVDAALAAGGRKSPRDLDRLLALLVLDELIDPREAARAEPAIDWAIVRGIDAVIAGERDPVRRIALGCSLPDWIAARLVADHGGAQAEALARGLNVRAPMTVRANSLKVDRARLAAALAEENLATTPGRWCPTALHLDTRTNLFATAAFKRGELEAQDEGSQLLAELAVPASGKGVVIDLCAGAGGKTLAIAAAMGNRGRIIATDVDDAKLEELRRRARRAGVTSAQAVLLAGTGDRPPALAAVAGRADVVLVDAPCSGLGSLRRNPEARWRLREADVADFARRQREILASAIELAAPGGVVIYATCTILRAENEDVVAAVRAACSTAVATPYSALRPDRAAALECGEHLITAPHRHGTDAFFAAALTRTGTGPDPGTGRAEQRPGD